MRGQLRIDVLPQALLGFCDAAPRVAVGLLQRRIAFHLRAELLFGRDLRAEDLGILERLGVAFQRLDRVFDAEEFARRDALLFGSFRLKLGEKAAELGQVEEPHRHGDVPLELELGDGEQPIGAPRVPGDEREVSLLGAGGRPFEVMLG